MFLIILINLFLLFPDTDVFSPWDQHTIDASSNGADGVKLADINNDGLQDIVTGWEEGGITKLYLHPGNENVKEEWPNVIVGKTPNVEDAVFADMNNDGGFEIVSCTEGKSKKIFIHYSEHHEFLNAEEWSQKVLPASDGKMMWMYAEPCQLDGKYGMDLIAAGKGENAQLGWFESPPISNDFNSWKWHPITSMGWVMSIILRDMDNDGDMDIIVTDRRAKLQGCRWLENPGVGEIQKDLWINHSIGADNLEVMFMTIADIDMDGKEEVVLSERTGQSIRIYKRQNNLGTRWSEKIIKIPISTGSAKSVEVGDVNGDEVPDLVLSTNTNGAEKTGLTWIDGKDLEKQDKIAFHPISGMHNAKYDKVELIDLDRDGDLDVLICEENYGPNSEGLGVIWYENPFQ